MTNYSNLPTEQHPFVPFLPEGAKLLMLGSFPQKPEKWSMPFFYPNWINDMWRILGSVFFDNKHYFEIPDSKQFDQEKIISFCTSQGIALYDVAVEVRRLKDNASDHFLEIITPTNLDTLLEQIPACQTIVTTGQKATDIISEIWDCPKPTVGQRVELKIKNKTLHFWRMPSSSRAYPLSLEKKASLYKQMFLSEQFFPLLHK